MTINLLIPEYMIADMGREASEELLSQIRATVEVETGCGWQWVNDPLTESWTLKQVVLPLFAHPNPGQPHE